MEKGRFRSPPLRHLLLVVGLLLLATWALGLIDSSLSSRSALQAFDQALAAQSAEGSLGEASKQADQQVDFSLWGDKRIREYKESLTLEKRLPTAVLSIEKLKLRVPVFEGTDELALNRGAGWIVGTARPGESGNVGIAAHRDGFFRGLKDIAVGDVVELKTLQQEATYVVDAIEIVSPEDVGVLRPRLSPSLTLVTCYPFYFVGDAPSRYIVHATQTRRLVTGPARGELPVEAKQPSLK